MKEINNERNKDIAKATKRETYKAKQEKKETKTKETKQIRNSTDLS